MTLNPFALAAKAFYTPFKTAILAAWNAAKSDALAEIRAGLPTDADVAEVNTVLTELREPKAAPPAIEDDEPAKRRAKK